VQSTRRARAVRLAGYSVTSAARQGWRLMGRPEIAALEDRLRDKLGR